MGQLRGQYRSIAFASAMLLATAVGVSQKTPEVVALAALAALGAMTLAQGAAARTLANTVTWSRILATAALVLLPSGSLGLALLAAAVFTLDIVDGAIARATNTASEFGAELDKECDAFFVLLVSVLLLAGGVAPGWVLIPGLWRYLYSLLVSAARELRPAPRSNWGRYSYSTACVCMILALWEKTPGAEILCAVATCLISASFMRSLYYCLPRS